MGADGRAHGLGFGRLPGVRGVETGRRPQTPPDQHVVIGQVGVDALIIRGLKERLIQRHGRVPLFRQPAQDLRYTFFHLRPVEEGGVAGGVGIAFQRQQRGHQFIQFKP